jgi:hypothetical protein
MNEENREHLQEITKDLANALMPFGYMDLQRAAVILEEAEITEYDFADYVNRFCEDTESKFSDLDICYLAYEYVLQETRNQINEALSVDILNDTSNFYVHGNYMCSSFDYDEDSKNKILEWIKEIEETRSNEFTQQMKFIKEELS